MPPLHRGVRSLGHPNPRPAPSATIAFHRLGRCEPLPRRPCVATPKLATEKGHPLHQVQGQHALLSASAVPSQTRALKVTWDLHPHREAAPSPAMTCGPAGQGQQDLRRGEAPSDTLPPSSLFIVSSWPGPGLEHRPWGWVWLRTPHQGSRSCWMRNVGLVLVGKWGVNDEPPGAGAREAGGLGAGGGARTGAPSPGPSSRGMRASVSPRSPRGP